MSQVEWYYARDNKQMGPVSAAELKRLASLGQLRPHDLVWREGLSEWAPAHSVRGLFDDEAATPQTVETPSQPVVDLSQAAAAPQAHARHLFDAMLDALRTRFDAGFIEKTANVFRSLGLRGLLAAMVVVVVIAAIETARGAAPLAIPWAAVMLLVLAMLHYAAGKFLAAIERLDRTTSAALSSTAIPDGFAVVNFVVGLVALLGSAAAAMASNLDYSAILWAIFGLAGFVVCAYAAVVAMNPAAISVSVNSDQTSPGREALGAIVFFLKLKMRAVPVAFGAGVIVGLTMLIGSQWNIAPLLLACQTLVLSAALPMIAYFVFLFYFLLVDLCRAVLNREKGDITDLGKPM